MIESDIRYAHAHLGEIFRDISGSLKEPYREWLLSVRDSMEKKRRPGFRGNLGGRSRQASEKKRASGEGALQAFSAWRAAGRVGFGIAAKDSQAL